MADQTLTVKIVGDEKDLLRAFRASSQATQRFSASFGTFLKGALVFEGVRRGIDAIGGALRSSGRSFSSFQETLSQTVGLAGNTRAEVERFSKEILALGPKVAKGPQELAETLYFVASAGVAVSDQMAVVRSSAQAAAAGLGSTQQVADAVTSAMNAYGAANLSAAQATDVLVNTVKFGKGEAEAFAPVIGNVSALAAELGVSFNEVGAALAAQTRLGTSAEIAAVQLQATFSSLLKVTPQQANALRAVGLSAAGLRDQLRSQGLLSVLSTLKDRFGENTAAMAEAFPNIRALRGLLSLVGKSAEDARSVFEGMTDSTGALADAFGAVSEDQAFKFRQTTAALQAIGIQLGAALAPAVSKVASAVNAGLGKLNEFMPQISAGIQSATRSVTPAVEDLVTAFASRLPELERIAGSVLEPLREHVVPVLRDVAQIVANFWSNVVSVFDSRSGQIRQILSNLGGVLANVWTIARPTIVFLFEKAIPAALDVAIPLIEKLTGITKTLSDVFVRVVSVIVKALDLFLGGLSKVADAASHLPFVGDFFKGIADKVNASRESLRAFSDQLDAIDGRKVQVSIAVDVTTGRREEGALGRSSDAVKKGTEEATKQAKDDLDAQRKAARDAERAASAATTETKKAKTAAERQREAFDALMATIGLRRDRAAATAGLKDDIAAAEQTKRALEAQLKVQKGNVELQRELLQVNQDLTALRREQRQGRQFEALGLTAEGEKRVPGVGALQSRLAKLRELVKGTVLDTSKTRSQLAAIAKVLSGQFGAVGREVRQAILGMFNDITGALDKGSKSQGPLTKFQKGGFGKLIEDVTGLTPEQIKALRQSFAQFGAGGTVPGKGVAAFGMAFPAAVAAPGAGGVTREEIHIYIDGEEVESRVTKRQQRKRGRSAASRRGVRPGIGGV